MKESIFALWGKRNPQYEIQYDETIVRQFCDYGKGTTQYSADKAKILGAGYEAYIIAFFIGLYFNQTKPLVDDKAKKKSFGQAIQYWGNQENRFGRSSYGQIRYYIFAALIARTDIDLIALDKGEITVRKVVDSLIDKMEQYANFGFSYMQEKMEVDPNYFFKETAFLHEFLAFLKPKVESADEDQLEELK